MFLLGGSLFAQTPGSVLVLKAAGFRQVSATSQEQVGAGFAAQVEFSSSVAASTAVQLRSPSGALTTLSRATGLVYELEREFANTAALNAAFPDGAYTLLVGGASVATVAVSGSAAPAPVLITNYTELQAAPADAEIRWQPIPRATRDDWLAVTITDARDQELFTTPEGFPGTETSAFARALPAGETLTGELFYGKVAISFANNGATVIGSAAAFGVEFSIVRAAAPPPPPPPPALPPVIVQQPFSRVAMVGESVGFVARASNATVYRWKRNGVVIPGRTTNELGLFNVQGSDAGAYVMEAENSAGVVVASEPAVLLIQPQMTVATYTGHNPLGTSVDGPVGSATFRDVRQMACDNSGSLYVIDGHAIRKIAGGVVTTLAGASQFPGYVDGPAAASRFEQPMGITADWVGGIYVSDTGNGRIRRITGLGEVGTVALPSLPYRGLVADATGNLYVRVGRDVMRITSAGVMTTFYRGPEITVLADTPLPIALDRAGNVYVSYNSDIVKLTPSGVATHFAGSSTRGEKTGGVAGDVFFGHITGLGADLAGNIYVAGGAKIWMIAPSLATAAINAGYIFNGMAVAPDGTLYGASVLSVMSVVRGQPIVRHSTESRVAILSTPASQTIAVGDTAALQVTATGPGLSYQWLREGVAISGANGPVLLVRNATQSADYSVVVGNGVGATTSAVARVNPVGTDNPGRLVNLSLRARAGSGAQTLIMGFGLAGSGATAGARTVLLRGIGPSLSAFGVGGALADPRLQLLDNIGATLATNDNWGGDRTLADAAASVGAFPLDPGSRDAALLSTLPARTYTAQVLGAGAASGIALAEVYDARRPSDAGDVRLVNVSARTVAGSGEDTLTAGIVVGGATAKTVLIRAVGPALAGFGISGVLRNPHLTLFSGQNRLAENDDWHTALTIDIFTAAGAFPLYGQDSALVATLAPGAYTVQVTGRPGEAVPNTVETAGIALVEVYELR